MNSDDGELRTFHKIKTIFWASKEVCYYGDGLVESEAVSYVEGTIGKEVR